MRKMVNSHMYDTATATLVLSRKFERSDLAGFGGPGTLPQTTKILGDRAVYRTKGGEFFIVERVEGERPWLNVVQEHNVLDYATGGLPAEEVARIEALFARWVKPRHRTPRTRARIV